MTEDRSTLPPSASELARIKACPGCLNLKRKLGHIPDEDNEDAASGTRCHAYYAGDKSTVLSDDELSISIRALEITDKLVEQLGFSHVKPIIEQRYFLAWDDFTGKPDRVYIDGHRAFIPDAKFGRIEVEASESNAQLRGYVVLLRCAYPMLTEIYTCPIQPWVTSAPSPVLYDTASMTEARQELASILGDAKNEDAPLIPGPHCQYCKCRGVNCTAVESDVKNQIALAPPNMELATNTQIALFLDWVDEFDPVATVKAAQEEAKRRIKAGESVGTWTLKPNAPMTPITDSELVFGRFCALGGTSEAFMSCVEIAKGKLKDAVKKVTDKKGKSLDEAIDDLLAGATTDKPKADSLKKAE